MLAVVRILALGVFIVVMGIIGCLFCLMRPFHRDNTRLFAHIFGYMHRILGLRLEIRVPQQVRDGGPFVYACNHQNSWDIFTLSGALPKNTVTIGKKSLVFIPFFGQLYWLAGNILIDRKNKGRAHSTITQASTAIKQRDISIWLFPEGTRSYGRGLLPFKKGAFHTAMRAGVDIVPVCVSNLHDKIKLNRWNNGVVIIEMLKPIPIQNYRRENIRELMARCHELMHAKISHLNEEVAQREGRQLTTDDVVSGDKDEV